MTVFARTIHHTHYCTLKKQNCLLAIGHTEEAVRIIKSISMITCSSYHLTSTHKVLEHHTDFPLITKITAKKVQSMNPENASGVYLLKTSETRSTAKFCVPRAPKATPGRLNRS